MEIKRGNHVRITSGPHQDETFVVDVVGWRTTGIVLYGHDSGPVMAADVELIRGDQQVDRYGRTVDDTGFDPN